MYQEVWADLTADEQEAVIARFHDLFAGRHDTYAIRLEFPESAAYVPSTYAGDSEHTRKLVNKVVSDIGSSDFTLEAVRAHIEGRHFLGVYPIAEDSTVRWFALDFDGKNGDPYEEARAQAMTLHNAGLNVYVERSQSGNGYHVWGFLKEPMNAGKVRHALSPLIERTDTYDRMFPNQDGVSATRPLGNLIALPFHGGRMADGNSVFVQRVDGEVVPVVAPFEFLSEHVTPNSTELLEQLFAEAGEHKPEREVRTYEGEPEGLSDSYKLTHPVFGCEFVRDAWNNPGALTEPLWYALACNFAQLEDGRDLFHRWSERDELRYNARATDRKYDQALRANKPHTCEAIRGLGGVCSCDQRFPGSVYHPFDLVKVSFRRLVDSVGVGGDLSDTILTADEGIDKAMERLRQIEKDPEAGQGMRYGIRTIDAATRLRPSDLIIIAARPGMGKTAFSGTVVDNLCMQGVPNYYFSVEMAHMQLFTRQLAVRSGVSMTRMSTGQLTKNDWALLEEAQELTRNVDKYPLYVDDMSRSTDRIFEVAAQLVHRHGVGVIWVDYLQLLQRQARESMFDAVTRITHDLKLLAKALQVPVVALTQLNRTADDATSDSQTYDSWLRGSGDIEQAADVIVFLLGEKGPGIKERIFALHKERHREAGLRIMLEFNQPIMRFAAQGTYGLTLDGHSSGVTRRREAPVVGEESDGDSLEAQQAENARAIKEFVRQRDESTQADLSGL